MRLPALRSDPPPPHTPSLTLTLTTTLLRPLLHAHSNLPGFRTLFSERFVWFPFRVDGISPGVQSEVNLYRKYKDFEEAGWVIMGSVRPPSLSLSLSLRLPIDLSRALPQR